MPTLALTTRAETYERLARLLPDHGIDVTHLRVDERAIHLPPAGSPWEGETADVGFVYPSRPMEGAVFDATRSIPWINDREAILRSRNKAGVLAAAGAAGVPTPRTVMISNPAPASAIDAAWERLEGPVVVKPNSATRGVGVAKAADKDTLHGIVDYLDLAHEFPATGDRSFLIQEFVPDARDLRVMVLEGEYVGAVERRRPDAQAAGWKQNVHRGATAVGIEASPGCQELAESVAELFDIPLLGVDLLVTADGPLLSETNARPTIDDPDKYNPEFVERLVELIQRTADAA